jgi:Fe-S-cluster containining protein
VPRKPSDEALPQEVRRSINVLDRIAEEMATDSGRRAFLQNSIPDKYSLPAGEPIDCENRVALCKAACCRLNVLLSPQDLAEGIASWDPQRPYFNAQDAAGYCAHLDQPACRCSIYANRPAPCRLYDCRHDSRIWTSFENRIANPALEKLDWPLNLNTDSDPLPPALNSRREGQPEKANLAQDTRRLYRQP